MRSLLYLSFAILMFLALQVNHSFAATTTSSSSDTSSSGVSRYVNLAQSLFQTQNNATCIQNNTIITMLLNNIASFGFINLWLPQVDMVDAEKASGKGGCTVPNKYMRFNLNPTVIIYPFFVTSSHKWDADKGITPLDIEPPVLARVSVKNDMICLEFLGVGTFIPIGCRYLPDYSLKPICDPKSFDAENGCTKLREDYSDCYAASQCLYSNFKSDASNESKTAIPFTSYVVSCVKKSLDKIFFAKDGESTKCGISLVKFTDLLKKVIKIVLVIYVAVFGIKILLGGDMPSKADFFSFVAKFILVTYFTIGLSGNDGRQSGQEFLQDAVSAATNTLSSIILNANESSIAQETQSASDSDISLSSITNASVGGASNATTSLCHFPMSSYKENSYLSIFDSLDCRIMHYFFLSTASMKSGLFNAVVGLILSLDIIVVVILIITSIFLISIIAHVVNVYLIAMVVQGILIFISPIFITFALFGFSKGYFESWVRMLIAFIIQPMVLCAFLAIIFTILDKTYYGNCEFVAKDEQGKTHFVLQLPQTDVSKCTNTIGYRFSSYADSNLRAVNGPFGVYVEFQVWGTIILDFLTLLLFSVIFWGYLDMLSGFAADISGGPNLGEHAISPKAIAAKAGGMAKSLGNKAMLQFKKKLPPPKAPQPQAGTGSQVTGNTGGGSQVTGNTGGGGQVTGNTGGGPGATPSATGTANQAAGNTGGGSSTNPSATGTGSRSGVSSS